jgi:hypothetical protein
MRLASGRLADRLADRPSLTTRAAGHAPGEHLPRSSAGRRPYGARLEPAARRLADSAHA